MTEKPLTLEYWIKETEFALEEALSIRKDSADSDNAVMLNDIYKMAPSIAAIFNGIENEESKEEMRELVWSNVLHIHQKIPKYKSKSRRCFVHAYLDSIIYLKLITVKQAEKIIDFLESEGKIEEWKV
jgi:hypothetical protein